MQALEQRDFETDVQRQVYDFVEQNGAVERTWLEEEFAIDAAELEEILTSLEEKSVLETDEELVRLAIDIGEGTTHTTDEFEYTIRPAEQSDLKGIVGVMRQVAEENDYLVAETVVDLLDHEEVVFRHNDIGSRIFFVATVDEDVVGWLHLEAPNYEKLAHTAELTMGVLEKFRGHGIGSTLMERGLQWATENGYEKVYQSVPATNQDAIRFLEDHRWETEAIRKAHYKIDDSYVAEQMMAVMIG
ncbi:GNAT family N-acetyltransferase [Halopiger djelfimassiliensis]|uniref:GNAT family N-acetyltransferase n=1 Tax=Halopiger djelfimassiliensis TaxID=1293047 RepID=UPI0006776015|nr:GNAT family N-acetyltransferase [Halopiger djelfimassiliensis]